MIALALLLAATVTVAPSPRPWVVYRVRVDPADTTGFSVEMTVHDAPRLLRLGLARHPEYDDQYWRCLVGLVISSAGRSLSVAREDSAIWRVRLPADSAVVSYRIVPPPLPANVGGVRSAWKPAVTSLGALVGGEDSFLYLVDDTLAPARVIFDHLPPGWQVVTGLDLTEAPAAYTAPDTRSLLDAPILVGRLRLWEVSSDHGAPALVAYLPSGDAASFDTAAFAGGVRRIVRATTELFRFRWPYRYYLFLVQGGALGALEHGNSMTIGAPSARLAADPSWPFMGIAHEFFHTWNLVRLRPAGWGALTTRPPARTTGLWWSEGVTIYFARALLRRAGLSSDSAARQQVANGLARWLGNPAQQTTPPERASWDINEPAIEGGPPRADVWTQGEVLGLALDVLIRDASGMTRSLDDAMRAMVERHGGPAGFTSGDLERTVGETCGCDLHRWFDDHVRGAAPLDFAAVLAPLGWVPVIARETVNGRERVTVRLDDVPTMTARQVAMRRSWLGH